MPESRAAVVRAEAKRDTVALRHARTSDDPTIRAAALGGLHRLGEITLEDLDAAAKDSDASVRCRAIELAITEPAIDLLHMLADSDDLVVETAAWALGERGSSDDSTIMRLSSIAETHEVSICREAAIAALGAIGSPDGLPAILRGMHDRAPVRRRAVLALAPFDTEEVTEALHTALNDRDRQVRQAAEDLVGVPPQPG